MSTNKITVKHNKAANEYVFTNGQPGLIAVLTEDTYGSDRVYGYTLTSYENDIATFSIGYSDFRTIKGTLEQAASDAEALFDRMVPLNYLPNCILNEDRRKAFERFRI